jgi:hypothetical protein
MCPVEIPNPSASTLIGPSLVQTLQMLTGLWDVHSSFKKKCQYKSEYCHPSCMRDVTERNYKVTYESTLAFPTAAIGACYFHGAGGGGTQ